MKKGTQTIGCSVHSCRWNENSAMCSLDSIQVAPCQHVHSGSAEEESLCASYERGKQTKTHASVLGNSYP